MSHLTSIAGTRLYLDANVIIYAAEGGPLLSNKLHSLLLRVDRDELQAITSELTLAEVLVKPFRDGDDQLAANYQRRLVDGPTLGVRPVSREVLVGAARLRATVNALKLADAIHAATSQLHQCTTFLTNDQRFEGVPNLPVLLLSNLPAR